MLSIERIGGKRFSIGSVRPFVAVVTPEMARNNIDRYWSPKQQKYVPSMVGSSLSDGPKGLAAELVKDLSYDVSLQFNQYSNEVVAEIEEVVRENFDHPNVENWVKGISWRVGHSGFSDISWGDARYSANLMELIKYRDAIRKFVASGELAHSAKAIRDWLSDYILSLEKSRQDSDRLIKLTVEFCMAAAGLDSSIDGPRRIFTSRDEHAIN